MLIEDIVDAVCFLEAPVYLRLGESSFLILGRAAVDAVLEKSDMYAVR